jgi:hypothetical protein
MAFTVKLICGPRTLNLNSGRYAVTAPFAPPAVALVPLMAGGTSANRWGGAERAGLGAVNREWTFGLHLRNCTSSAEVRAAAADLAYMLSLAGDPDQPLYLFFKPDSNISAEPMWGQAGVYYEIAHADPPDLPPGGFFQFQKGKAYPNVRVSCSIRPFARGKTQAAGSATGGVLEDTLGTVDGQSRGVIVPRATTNKMTNPVFGHATWNNSWTTDANLASSQETNPELVLFGASSARLTAVNTTSIAFTQNINVGNTNTHTLSCYVRLPDGTQPSGSDMTLYYGAAQTTSFYSVGNGWWRAVSASFAGVAAGTASGVAVFNKHTVIVDGFQLEELSFETPLAWGDLLGCAWTGTVHASTSTRTAARLSVPSAKVLTMGQGTIRVVWKAPYVSTIGNDMYLFHVTTLNAFYQASSDKFAFGDGTNSALTAVQTFSAGDIFVFHFVYGSNGLVIYQDGASAATNATYSPAALGASFFIGTDESSALHGYGPFLDVTTWDVAFTAAEALADYNNVAPLVADDQRVGAIPWLWTFDGDNVIDTLYNGTAWNSFVVGGVPGSAPAQTAVKITGSAAISGFSSIWFGVLPADIHIPLSNFFEEQTGTSSIGTSLGTTSKQISLPPYHFYTRMQGREWHLFAPCSTAGTGLSLAAALVYTSGGVEAIINEAIGVDADGTNRTFWTRAIVLRRLRQVYPTNLLFQVAYDLALYASHSGGTADLTVDKLFLVPRPLTRVEMPHTTSETILHFSGPNAQITTTTGDVPEELAYVRGDEFELFPAVYNHVITVQGDPVRAYSATLTFTINSFLVLPRYLLL